MFGSSYTSLSSTFQSNHLIVIYHWVCIDVRICSPGWVVWPNYEVVEFLPRSGTTAALDSVTYFYVPIYLHIICFSSRTNEPGRCSCPHHPILTRLTWTHHLTHTRTRTGPPTTWASPISVPQFPNPPFSAPVVFPFTPNSCYSCPAATSWIPMRFPPKLTRFVSTAPIVATMHPSYVLSPHSPSTLCIPQISATAPLTVAPSPVFFQCRLFAADFLPLPALPLPLVYTTSRPLSNAPSFIWFVSETRCVYLPRLYSLPQIVTDYPSHIGTQHVSPHCRTFLPLWGPILPFVTFPPISPRHSMSAWCSVVLLASHSLVGPGGASDN